LIQVTGVKPSTAMMEARWLGNVGISDRDERSS
jgi:hypothetical protein